MTTLCARPGCGRAATVAFVFDSRVQTVWLDHYRDGMPGAGVLCDRHADRLTPPRGWNLQDRRPAAPRLWADRPVPGAAPRPSRRRTRLAVACTANPSPASLPFDTSPALAATPPAAVPPAEELPSTPAWLPRREQGPELDPVLDVQSPLLSRAFQPLRRS